MAKCSKRRRFSLLRQLRRRRTARAAMGMETLEPRAMLATLYWDPNGATPGVGGSGTWDLSTANWTTDPSGSSPTIAWTNNAADVAVFNTTPDSSGSVPASTVTIGSGIAASQAAFPSGAYTLQGGSLSVPSGLTIGVDVGGSATWAGAFSGAGSLVKTGPGTLTVSGSNTGLSGGARLEGGTLVVANNAALGTGMIQMAGGSLQASGARTLANTIQAVAGTTSTLVSPSASNLTLNGSITGSGTLQKTGAYSVFLGGDNSAFSGTFIHQSSNLYFNTPAAGSALAAWAINGGSQLGMNFSGNAVVQFGSLSGTSGWIHGGYVKTGIKTIEVGALGTSTTYAGRFIDYDTTNGGSQIALRKIGSGTLTLTAGSNPYVGGSRIEAGSVVVGSDTALGSGTIQLAGGILQASGNRSLANAIQAVAGTTSTLVSPSGSNLTLNGSITGSGTLQKTGAYSVFLGGDNSAFAGTFVHQASNLYFNTPSAGSALAAWVINGGGQLGMNFSGNAAVQFGSLAGTSGVIHGGYGKTGTKTIEVGALGTSTTYSGRFTDYDTTNGGSQIAVRKVGSGTWTLSNATSTFTGNVSVNGGEVASAAGTSTTNPTQSPLGNPLAAHSVTVTTGATLRFTVDNAFGGSTSTPLVTTVAQGGTITSADGAFTTLGPVVLKGGTIDSGTPDPVYGSFQLRSGLTAAETATSYLKARNMHMPASSPGIVLQDGVRLEQSGNFDAVSGLGASTVATHGDGILAVTASMKQYRIVSAHFSKGESSAIYVPSSADLTPQVPAGSDGWVSAESLAAALQQVMSFSFTVDGRSASFGGSGNSRGFKAATESGSPGRFTETIGFEDWTDGDYNDAYLSYTVEVREVPSEDPRPQCTSSPTCSPINAGAAGNSTVTAASGIGAQYASNAVNGNAIVKAPWRIDAAQGVPDSVEVRLMFNGVQQPSVFLDPAGLAAGDTFTAAAAADTTSLPTGRYAWSMSLVSHYGTTQLEQTVTGQQDVVSRAASEFGSGWWLPELDRLDVTTDGVNLITGLNQAVWFTHSGSTYAAEAGNPTIATLVKNADDSFTLTYTDGSRSAFSPTGVLTSRFDSTGNARNYTYADKDSDGMADELVSITDEAGRTATLTYTDGKVTQIEDFEGRVTGFTFNGGLLSAITAGDPDGSGPLTSPVTSYDYNGSGLLTKVTDPLGSQSQVSYDFTGRVSSIQQACGGTTTLASYATSGLPNVAVVGYDAAHPAPIVRQTDTVEHRTDEHGNLTRIVRDHLGNVLQEIDALGNVTTFSRDTNGLVTRLVQSDPDGAGPLGQLVTQFTYDSRGNLTSRINPDATEELWTYDPVFGKPTSYTDPLGHKTHWSISPTNGLVLSMTRVVGAVDSPTNHETNDVVTTYTHTVGLGGVPAGLVQTMTDALGRVTSYTYTSRGLLQSMTRAVGTADQTTTTFEYDSSDNLTAVIDGLARHTEYAYDALNRMVSMSQPDPDGAGTEAAPIWRFGYDANGNRTSMTDPLGNVTQYLYDVRGRLSGVTLPDPDGSGPQTAPTTTNHFDCVSNLVAVSDALGRTTTYDYDALNRRIAAIQPDPDGAGALTAPTTHTAYNAVGWVTSTTDALGNTTSYVYDAMGRVLSITQPDPDAAGPLTAPVTSYTYDAAGQRLTTTDPLGRVTSYSYDVLGRVVTVTQPDPDGAGPLTAPVTTYGYDKMGNRTNVTDPLGHVTSYGYDNLDRLISVTDADPDGSGPLSSPVTTYAYDAASQLVSTTDPLGRVTTNEYDNLGRLTKTTQPDPNGSGPALAAWTVFTYDAVGNVLSRSDRLGNTTSSTYDNLYRVIASTDANGGVTATTYDSAGNRLSLTDPAGNTTSWTYDTLDRVIQDQNPLGASRSFSYDAASNLVQKTDRDGRVTQYTYDNLKRQTSEQWLAGSSVVKTFTYSYDASSQLLGAGDGTANNNYQYDNLGRVTQSAATVSGLASAVTMTQGYDAASRRTSLFAAIGSTADFKNLFAYDNVNRLTSVTQQGQTGGDSVAPKRVDFGYLADGQLAQMTRFANLAGTQSVASTAFGHDAAGRLTSLVHSKNATVFASYGYGYDAGSRMTSFTNSAYPAEDATYANDATGQLTGADRTGASSDEAYAYDANGNRLTANGSTYATEANNRLLSDGTNSYAYDAEGNITRITNTATGDYRQLTWDYRNRLVQVTQFDASANEQWRVAYTYDSLNRLVTRTEYVGAATTPSSNAFFAYDGYQMVLKLGASGNVEGRTLWGNGTDQILTSEDASGNVLWPLTDHLNTVREIVSYNAATDTTTLENHIVYDSFGNVVSQTDPSVASAFQFTARYTDATTGLQWNLNRWYLPSIGRWASEDPIGFEAGDLNLARYVGNGPTRLLDPTGLDDQPPTPPPSTPPRLPGGLPPVVPPDWPGFGPPHGPIKDLPPVDSPWNGPLGLGCAPSFFEAIEKMRDRVLSLAEEYGERATKKLNSPEILGGIAARMKTLPPGMTFEQFTSRFLGIAGQAAVDVLRGIAKEDGADLSFDMGISTPGPRGQCHRELSLRGRLQAWRPDKLNFRGDLKALYQQYEAGELQNIESALKAASLGFDFGWRF